MSERWAILVLFGLAAAGWGVYSNLSTDGLDVLIGALITVFVLSNWWARADAKAMAVEGPSLMEGLPSYLVRSRGLAVGMVWLIGFVALYLAAYAGGTVLGEGL